jgi:arsenite methyltransferase
MECASCQLFELESQGEDCFHINRPGGLTLTEQAIDLCHLPRNARILDVASGTGASLQYLTHHKKYNAIGLDFSHKMLLIGLDTYPDLTRLQADGGKLPFPDSSQDAVLMECALSFSNCAGVMINEFNRVLCQGGRLIVTDIYIRDLIDPSGMSYLSTAHCLAGVMTEEMIRSTITHQGFHVTTWQDHTFELKQWMACMVFKTGSLGAFYHLLVSNQKNAERLCEALGKKLKLGYYLLIAEKQAEMA